MLIYEEQKVQNEDDYNVETFTRVNKDQPADKWLMAWKMRRTVVRVVMVVMVGMVEAVEAMVEEDETTWSEVQATASLQ